MVYQIAARRHETKQGFDHMSDHAHEVLQQRTVEEAAQAVSLAMGSINWFR